jgi:hypothetical protein
MVVGTCQEPIITKLHAMHERTWICGYIFEEDNRDRFRASNNIIHLYLCLIQNNQIKTTYEHIHGSYIIIMVFVVTNRSACICVLFERQNSKSEIDVLKISEQWWRLNISFNLTAAFSTSNKMAIIGTVPFRLTAKNNFIKGPWYERAYDNYKYSVKG